MKNGIFSPAALISNLKNKYSNNDEQKLASLTTGHIEIKKHYAVAVLMMSMHEYRITSDQQKDKAISLESMKSSLENVHGYTMLNRLHPHEKERNRCMQLDDDFEENLSAILAKRFAKVDTKNLKLEEYPVSLIFVGHGAPSWFFAADGDYRQKKIGLIRFEDKIDMQQLEGFTYPHLILTKDKCYFLNPEKAGHQVKLQQLPIEDKKFTNLKLFFNPSLMKQAYQHYIPVLLPKDIERIEFLLGFSISQRIAGSFRRNDFLQAEINAAEKIAAIISKVEQNTPIKFNSMLLFSCHSAAEFNNTKTGEYSISSARMLSCFLDHPIVGCLGINGDVKTSGLHELGKAEEQKYRLIETVVVYQNKKVILGPKKDFYLAETALHDFIIDLVFANVYQKSYLLEHVLERFEQDVVSANHLNNPDHFGTAQLELISTKMKA